VLSKAGASAILSGGTINLPDTTVFSSTPGAVVVRVRNTGNADGKIASIDISSARFSLTQVPFVPLTLTDLLSLEVAAASYGELYDPGRLHGGGLSE
jgi:hypothetical protein